MSACDPLIQAERRFKARCLNQKQVGFVPLPRAGGALSHAVPSIDYLQGHGQTAVCSTCRIRWDDIRTGADRMTISGQLAFQRGASWKRVPEILLPITILSRHTIRSLAGELLGTGHGETLHPDGLGSIAGRLRTSDVNAVLAGSNCAHPFVIDLR
jgi:hypothetical protein